jgi:diacylglycerol kinase (ATP)
MVIILHNPLSKNKKSKRTTKNLVDYFKRERIPFRVKSLLKIQDLEIYLNKTPDTIKLILLGGDGTINTFINHTLAFDFKHEIFLKSNGSGNDFLRSLKKHHADRQYIMKMQYDDQTRYFINGSGIGMDGMIGHLVNQSINKNKFNYFLNTLKAFLRYKPKYAEVTLDGERYKFKKTYLVNVNNGSYIGGGMKISTKANIGEKNLDVVVIHGINRVLLFFIFLTVYFGKHTLFKRYVFYKKAKTVHATMFSPQIAQCDGECFDNVSEITVTTTENQTNFKLFEKSVI